MKLCPWNRHSHAIGIFSQPLARIHEILFMDINSPCLNHWPRAPPPSLLLHVGVYFTAISSDAWKLNYRCYHFPALASVHKMFTCTLLRGKNCITSSQVYHQVTSILWWLNIMRVWHKDINQRGTTYRNWCQGRWLCKTDSCEITYDLKEKSALYVIT